MAKELSVHKKRRLINLEFFLSFSYCNFGDTFINYDGDMFRKESFGGTKSYS